MASTLAWQIGQSARCSSSQSRSASLCSWPSSRMARRGSARSHSAEVTATEASAVPRSSSRSLIRAREISCATELRFMSMTSAMSS